MKHQMRKFRSLGWKLTFSYTFVTVTAVLLLEALGLIISMTVLARPQTFQRVVEELATDMAASSQLFFTQGEVDPQAIRGWLVSSLPPEQKENSLLFQLSNSPQASPSPGSLSAGANDLAAITGIDGNYIGANMPDDSIGLEEGEAFVDDFAPLESQTVVAAALQGEVSSMRTAQGVYVGAAPIRGVDNKIRGVLYLRMVSFNIPTLSWQALQGVLSLLGVTALIFTLGAGMIGTIFGFFTARGLSLRLRNVSQAADSWSRGDFSAFIGDRSEDELGHLSKRLNSMAEQLQNLFYTRQELAALEERNRMARDLHDSVKQQVFATAMQVGAARALLTRFTNEEGAAHAGSDLREAARRLEQAEYLARQAQAELTGLIHELRPSALEGRGLAPAVREYTQEWSRYQNIPVDLRVQGERRLPLETEQSLFRVVQEGLANVVRHSAAKQVRLSLNWTETQLELSMEDDGCGFNSQAEPQPQGIGLHSMCERVEAQGGQFRVESAPGAGTKLYASVPAISDTIG